MGMDLHFKGIAGTDDALRFIDVGRDQGRSAKTRPMNSAFNAMELPLPPENILKFFGWDELYRYDKQQYTFVPAERWGEVMDRTHEECEWLGAAQDIGFNFVQQALDACPDARYVVVEVSV